MIMQNPVLLIAVPLLLAFLIPVFSSFFKGAVRFIPVLAGGFNVIATALLISRASGSVTVTEIGGWASAYGISLLFSSQIGYVILAVNLTALLAIFYYTLNERDLGSPLAYPIAFTLALSGANGMIMTGDLFNLFVFMEMTAIAGYIIAVHKKGYLGTFRFVVLSSVGSALFLMATAALYNATGFLNMALAGESLGGLAAPFISIISVLFIMALSSEAELLPLNGWVAPVYRESSGAGSVFFASVFSGAALFAVIKVMLIVFGHNYAYVHQGLLVLGLVTLAAGEAAAFKQSNLKKMVAYSSIAQSGLIIAAVAAAMRSGVLHNGLFSAALFQLINNILAKALVLLGIALLGLATLKEIGGAGTRKKWLGVFISAGVLSLIGMPGFAGFWSKLFLVRELVGSGMFVFTLVFLLAALFEAYYYLRFLQSLFLGKSTTAASLPKTSWVTTILLFVLAALIILIGFAPDVIIRAISGLSLGGVL